MKPRNEAGPNGSSGLYSLPRGRHRIPRELVAQNQRGRLLAGVGRVLGERGYGGLTVARVIDAAGVSRVTFYEHFENKQGAVLAAHEDAFERLLCLLIRACNSEREWPFKVRAAIGATLEFAAAEPDRARLLILGSLSADRTSAAPDRLPRAFRHPPRSPAASTAPRASRSPRSPSAPWSARSPRSSPPASTAAIPPSFWTSSPSLSSSSWFNTWERGRRRGWRAAT